MEAPEKFRDDCEEEIFAVRQQWDDVEFYRDELANIHSELGGCTCWISAPCSHCMADVSAYEATQRHIKATPSITRMEVADASALFGLEFVAETERM
jgi:uncharacterized protein YcbX